MNYVCQEAEKLLTALNNIGLSVEQYKIISDNIDGLVLAVNSQNGKHKEFAQSVRAMREQQKAYFGAKARKDWDMSAHYLTQAKKLEKEVDQEAEEIVSGVKQIVLF